MVFPQLLRRAFVRENLLATHGDSESEKPVAELLNADPLAGRDKCQSYLEMMQS